MTLVPKNWRKEKKQSLKVKSNIKDNEWEQPQVANYGGKNTILLLI